MSKQKVWDVVAPRDEWERKYCHLEYLRIGLLRKLAKTIEVK